MGGARWSLCKVSSTKTGIQFPFLVPISGPADGLLFPSRPSRKSFQVIHWNRAHPSSPSAAALAGFTIGLHNAQRSLDNCLNSISSSHMLMGFFQQSEPHYEICLLLLPTPGPYWSSTWKAYHIPPCARAPVTAWAHPSSWPPTVQNAVVPYNVIQGVFQHTCANMPNTLYLAKFRPKGGSKNMSSLKAVTFSML